MTRPPRIWRRVLGWVVPPGDRASLVHEMDRLFHNRMAKDGPDSARRWYRTEVLHFVKRVPVEVAHALSLSTITEAVAAIRGLGQTVRSLRKAPSFSLLTSGTLALGIGAGALIVGIADRALFRPLPYPDADRIVAVLEGWGTSPGTVDVMKAEMSTLDELGAAMNATGLTWERDGAVPLRISAAEVTPGYLESVGLTPAMGRLFQPLESDVGAPRVVALGDGFWREHLNADPSVIGRSLTLDDESHRIVAILPRHFDLPSPQNDVWRPARLDPANPGAHWGTGLFTVLARMKPGVTEDQVRQDVIRAGEVARLANPLWTPGPDFWDEAKVTSLQEAKSQFVRTPLRILLGAVALVLLVVAANVASLFLSRTLSRGQSLTVRAALGARGARLAAEQILEVLVLTVTGLVGGLGIAYLGLHLIRPYLPEELPVGVGLDARIVAITGGIALLTALAAAVLPALKVAAHAPAPALRTGGRGGGQSRSRRRATRLLVGAQLALAIVLVASGGLLTRTIMALSEVDPGFETDNRFTARVHLPAALADDREARASYYEALEEAVRSRPEIANAAVASTIPFGQETENIATAIDNVTLDPNDLPVFPHHRVSPSYFEVAGIPVLRGRPFNAGDRLDGTPVAIVNESFERQFLAGESALGKVVRYPWRGAPAMEVVGVVGSVRHGDLAEAPQPTLWVPLAQMGMGALGQATVVVQGAAGRGDPLTGIATAVASHDDRIAVSDLVPYESLLSRSLAQQRLVMILLLVFAGTALALGCVGVYGVASFSVRQRLREFGVRLALGASTGQVRGRVLRDGLGLVLPGAVAGLVLAVPAAQALEGVLYGVNAFDPLTLGVAPLILAGAAGLATYVPARRATRVDPAVVLREE